MIDTKVKRDYIAYNITPYIEFSKIRYMMRGSSSIIRYYMPFTKYLSYVLTYDIQLYDNYFRFLYLEIIKILDCNKIPDEIKQYCICFIHNTFDHKNYDIQIKVKSQLAQRYKNYLNLSIEECDLK